MAGPALTGTDPSWAAANTNIMAMIDADLTSHRAMHAANSNSLIGTITPLHWCHMRRVMCEALQVSPLRTTVLNKHHAKEDAVARGEADRVSERMLSHDSQATAAVNALFP